MSRASCLLVVGALLFPLLLVPMPNVEAHHYSPIQPGGQFYTSGSWCTFNLVFEDPAGKRYIGAAAHCSGAVGTRVTTDGDFEFATVVYRALGHGHDFALFEIDEDKHHLIDPSIRSIGGPVGIATAYVPGTPLVSYGQGVGLSTTEVTRHHGGILEMVYGEGDMPDPYDLPGWYLGVHTVTGGDSGGAILTADGYALGTVIGVAATWGQPGYVNGPTFQRIIPELHAAGFEVEVITAQYRLADPTAAPAIDIVEHCIREPQGGMFSDACVRDAYPWNRPGYPNPPGNLEEPVRYEGEVWAEGMIRLGGPQAGFRTVTSYERVVSPDGSPIVGLDSFFVTAPPAGTRIATRTADGSGLGYDIDLHFARGPGNWYVEPHGCATPSPEESCVVPEGVTEIEVSAYFGAMLHVEILILSD